MDFTEIAGRVEERLDLVLSPARAAHSRGVAGLAAELCRRHGLEASRGRLAGLAHDMCKEMPKRELRLLAAEYPGIVAGSALLADKILHGPAAAVLLRRDYGVDDPELLEAVALHTVGKPGMSGLCLFVYCADKLEPGRGHVDPAFLERCIGLPPSEMLLMVVADTIDWLAMRGHDIAPETRLLYDSLVNVVPAP